MKKRLAWAAVITLAALVLIPLYYAEKVKNVAAYLEIIGIITTLGYLNQLHKYSHAFLYTSFYQIYSLLGIGISLLFIGGGTPMLEIDQAGTRNGAIWIALLFLIFGLEFGRLGFYFANAKCYFKCSKFSKNTSRILVLITSTIVLTIGLIILMRYGGAAFSGVTRVAFWNNVVPDVFRLYPSLLGQTFFLCAFLYTTRKINGHTTAVESIIVLMYIFATIIIVGEKFSTFIFYITAWLALHAGLSKFKISNKKIFVSSAVTLITIFVILIASYSAADKDAIFILYRIAMQGQLLWSVLSEKPEILLFGYNSSCYLGCESYKSGVDFISSRYLPASIWESYVATGSGLTGFMPALPILTLGLPVALLAQATISFAFGMIQRVLTEKIKKQDLVTSLLLFKIYFGFVVAWYASKTSALPGALVTLIILVIWTLTIRTREKP